MIRAGMKLRAGCLALRVRWVEQVEHERDEALASRDEARELRQIAEARATASGSTARHLDEQVADTERVLTSRGYPHPGGGENLALSVDNALDREASRYVELRDGIVAELRAAGHPFTGDVVRAVDAAIDRERCGAQEFLAQVAREVGAPPARRFGSYSWPADTDELLRHIAKRRRDAEIGVRAIRDRDRAVQLLADMLGKFAPDAFVGARAELEDLQGVSPSDHGEALAALVRRVGDVPREAYDLAMGGDIEPPPGRDEGTLTPSGQGCPACGMGGLVCSAHPEVPPAATTSRPDACPCGAPMRRCVRGCEVLVGSRLMDLLNGAAGLTEEIRRTRAVLAPDVDTTGTPLDALAATSIDSNRTQAVAAELRWWIAPGNSHAMAYGADADDMRTRAEALDPDGITPTGGLPPRPDVWAADREVEVPF